MLTKQLLKNKNFYLLMGYQLFAGLADRMFQFCIPLLVYELTGSASQMVFTFGITMAPYLIFSFFGGSFVDYFNKRTVLLITTSLSGLTLLIFSFAILHSSEVIDLELIYALCFLLATYNALDAPAFDASVVDYFEKNELISINSTMEIILSMSEAIGPLLGGAVALMFGAKYAIFAITFIYIGSFILMKISKPVRMSSACRKFGSAGEFLYEHCEFIKSGFEYIFKPENPILLVLMMTFLSNVFFGTKDILMIYIARDNFGMNAEALASVVTLGTVFSLLFIVAFSQKLNKFHPFAMLAYIMLIKAICSIVIGISNFKIITLVTYCLAGLAVTLYTIIGRTFRQTYVTPFYMGRVAGIAKSLAFGAAGFGSFFSGFLFQFISVKTYFVLGGILLAFAAYISYFLQRRFNPAVFKTNEG